MAKTIGSLRQWDCVSATIVLATGVYVTFQVKHGKYPCVRTLDEVTRWRMHRPNEFPPIEAGMYIAAKRAVVAKILEHRASMNLPPPVRKLRKAGRSFQYLMDLRFHESAS